MAITGAGNPVGGSNPSGISSGLNYIGDHAYGISGLVSATNIETTLLEFYVGSEYVVGTVQFMYATVSNDPFKYRIYFNDQVIAMYGVTMSGDYSQNETGPEHDVVRLVIPSYTKVKMTAENEGSSNGRDQCAICQGRVYG